MVIAGPPIPDPVPPRIERAAPPGGKVGNRVGSIDAYRGLVMLLMMGEVVELSRVAKALPESGFWSTLAYHQSHVEWIGCSLHDLIQPSFSFLVGVALPFSLARRLSEGQSGWVRTLHAFWRALVLVLLGVFLRSIGHKQTYWTFEDTLTQIGLGYGFLFILANRSVVVQWTALAVILVGYWAAFAMYPLPDKEFDWDAAGVKQHDPQTQLAGFADHWSKNTNAAWVFDTWFLNKFPRESKFTHNEGGYATLSFIPTLGTMILGLLAGGVLARAGQPQTGASVRSSPGHPAAAIEKVGWLAAAGVLSLAAGWLLGALGICPVVKRIWTPSWVLFSGGWCFLFLAGFYLIMDVWRLRGWAFVLVVIGMNSIAAYLIAHLFPHFIREALPRHFGAEAFKSFGTAYEPFLLGLGVLVVEWLILFWMYRRKIFLRI